MLVCKKCKNPIPAESLFCMYCGRSLAPPEKKPARRRRRPNGSGKVTKLPGNRQKPWAAYYPSSMGGKLVGTYATETEAILALSQAIATRPPSARAEWTVQNFYDYYTASERYKKLAVSTQKAYKSAWRHIEDLASVRMNAVQVSDWQECINIMIDSDLSESSCRNVKDLISALCREALKDDVIKRNHAELLDMGGKKAKERNVFTYDEIKLLQKHDDDVRVKFILLLVYTGLRVSELCDMLAEDVHEKYMVGGTKTAAGKRRIIPILPIIRPYVDYFLEGKSKYLIHRNGEHLTANYTRKYWFYPALVDLKILTPEETAKGAVPRITQHYARHTFATLADEAKVEKNVIARVIGHTSFTTTDKYYIDMQADRLYNEIMDVNRIVDANCSKTAETIPN